MFNDKLAKVVSVENLIEMGFNERHDGSGDPRGTWWEIKNSNFYLSIDPWFEVKLCRINPDTDPITLIVETKYELQNAIDWIAD